MKVQSPKSKVQSLSFEEQLLRPMELGYLGKAAEDSRTPRRCREFAHATPSARSWSAAVLCRFHFRNSTRHSSLATRHTLK
jgi:hypothetical protein